MYTVQGKCLCPECEREVDKVKVKSPELYGSRHFDLKRGGFCNGSMMVVSSSVA